MEPDPQSEAIRAATPTLLVRAAGGVVVGAGALALLLGVQTLTGFWVSARNKALVGLVMALGAGAVVTGLALLRGRAWGAIGATIAGALLFFTTAGWLWISLTGGLVSLFALGAPFVSFAAVVLAAAAIGPALRSTEARARLREEGMDLGT